MVLLVSGKVKIRFQCAQKRSFQTGTGKYLNLVLRLERFLKRNTKEEEKKRALRSATLRKPYTIVRNKIDLIFRVGFPLSLFCVYGPFRYIPSFLF